MRVTVIVLQLGDSIYFWPSGSVPCKKKQFDIPVLAFWCCGPEARQITSVQSPLTKDSHTDSFNNQLCALLIKETGECEEAKGMIGESYSFGRLQARKPYLPVLQLYYILISFLCILFQPHCAFEGPSGISSFFLYYGLYRGGFSLKCLSLPTSPGWLFLAIPLSAAVTIPAKIPTHLTVTFCPLVLLGLSSESYFLLPLLLGFQLCAW